MASRFGIRRTIWFTLGLGALVLGLIGALLPVLPTTPFVLVAAFAFSRSSKRFEAWLLANPVFGPVIEDWRENGAVAPRIKVIAITMMGVSIALALALGSPLIVIGIQSACIAAVSVYILTRPSH